MVSPDPYFSWRVLLLPWMVEQPEKTFLFCYDEPWDSPDNLDQLRSVEMPFAYRPVRRQLPAPYYTGCRMFVGKDLPFSRPNGVRWEDLPSPAETFLVVEAKEPVAWTEPRELVYNPKQPLPELGGEFNDGFAALMADGSVRFVKHSASEQVLRAYITGRPEDHSRSGR